MGICGLGFDLLAGCRAGLASFRHTEEGNGGGRVLVHLSPRSSQGQGGHPGRGRSVIENSERQVGEPGALQHHWNMKGKEG